LTFRQVQEKLRAAGVPAGEGSTQQWIGRQMAAKKIKKVEGSKVGKSGRLRRDVRYILA
jgi:hypothetical protein